MDRVPAQLLPAGPGAGSSLPSSVPRISGEGLRRRQTEPLRRLGVAPRPPRLPAPPPPRPKIQMGGLRQTTLRWTRTGVGLFARYTHRVAISNDRLIGIGDGKVRFRWR